MTTDRRPGRKPGEKKSRLGLWTAVSFSVLVLLYVGILELSRPHVSGDRLRLDQFSGLVEGGRLRSASVLDEDAYVVGTYTLDDGTLGRYNTPLLRSAQNEVTGLLLKFNVPTTVDQQVGKRVASLASVLLPGLILTLVFIYLILSYRRGTGLFSVRSGARRISAEQAGVTFADVAGQDAAVLELKEVQQFLADPARFAAVGATVPKGILLYGPPGCGKTLLARALAGEADASFFSISGSDFVEMYVGVGASRVRELFREARSASPAVVFIDELDSIGRARGGMGEGEREQALNQILAEMDGFSSSEGIVVLAATNRPDVLDQALLRPGRFDRAVGLERPDEGARLAILQLHTANKRLEEGADLAGAAKRAIGLTGADLANVLNEAALLAARGERAAISQADLDQALQRVLETPDRQRRLSLKDKGIGRRFSSEQRATFAEVAGADDAIAELAEVKEYLADPDRFARLGARGPRGILLSGPPGAGKTLLARAVAGEANAAFFSVASSEFVEVFVGEGASRVRDLFAEARAVAPAIVFLDEIDAIGARRGVATDGGRDRDQTLNQILVELDGFEARGAVIVMAATNRPDILDPALVRPGRFDRHVTLSLPDRAGRAAILSLHLRAVPAASDVDPDALARLTQGFSGADLANVVNEAALLASRQGLDQVPMSCLDQAIDRAMLGVASTGLVLTDRERAMTAYHAAGHALAAAARPGVASPHKLVLTGWGPARGHCALTEGADAATLSRSRLLDTLVVLLAGREAEELVFDDVVSVGSGDLARAGEIARHLVCQLGMGERARFLPHTWAPSAAGGGGGGGGYSEETTRAIEAEIGRVLTEASAAARRLLTEGRTDLDRVADALVERETLTAVEVQALLAGGAVDGQGGRQPTEAAR